MVCLAASARAALVVNIGSVTASPGSIGSALDVTLANTGSTAVSNIGGFAFEIMAPSSSITFTADNTSTTSPYIFAGSSVFGPNASLQPPILPGQTLAALDITNLGSGVTLNANSSLGLGHVLFNVAPGAAPGPVTVTSLGFPVTNLSSTAGANITLGSLNSGVITIQGAGATVPEPSSLFLGLVAALILMAVGGIWSAAGRFSTRSPATRNT
jgi:hypothetical protein